MDKKLVLFVILLLVGVWVVVEFLQGPTPTPPEFPAFLVRGPWAAARHEEVVISFQVDTPQEGTLLYWPEGSDEPVEVSFSAEAGQPVHLALEGLPPGREYRYQLVFSDGLKTPSGRFVTPPAEFTPFTFLVYGDTRTFPERHRLVTDRMAAEEAAFVIHTGDLVNSPINRDWDAFFSSGRRLFSSTLFYPVIGNHERNSLTYYRLFELPGAGGKQGEQWWAFYWGDVLFVGLDSNTQYLGVDGLREETDWLRETLSQPARFTFVFFHHPLFSSDPHYGGNEGLAALWHPLFVELGVEAVFSGHVHAYEHLVRDGVHYLTTGGGGAPAYPLGEPIEGTIFAVSFILHYLRVEVEEEGVEVHMIPVAEVPEGESPGEVRLLSGEPQESFWISPRLPVEVPTP